MSSAPGNESAASKLANTAGEAAANIPRTGVSGKRWLAIVGAGALIVSGSVFAYKKKRRLPLTAVKSLPRFAKTQKLGVGLKTPNVRKRVKPLTPVTPHPARIVITAATITAGQTQTLVRTITSPMSPTRSCGTTLAVRLAGTGVFPQ